MAARRLRVPIESFQVPAARSHGIVTPRAFAARRIGGLAGLADGPRHAYLGGRQGKAIQTPGTGMSVSMSRAVIAMVLLLISQASALADVRILASPGGEAGAYLRLFEALNRSGERVVIDGPCYSACTLVLTAIPHDRVCATKRAVLGFHAPQLVDQAGHKYAAPDATRLIAASYPPEIRNWIEQHGGLTAKPIFLAGRALAALVQRCS
jgi:hypothetical protein